MAKVSRQKFVSKINSQLKRLAKNGVEVSPIELWLQTDISKKPGYPLKMFKALQQCDESLSEEVNSLLGLDDCWAQKDIEAKKREIERADVKEVVSPLLANFEKVENELRKRGLLYSDFYGREKLDDLLWKVPRSIRLLECCEKMEEVQELMAEGRALLNGMSVFCVREDYHERLKKLDLKMFLDYPEIYTSFEKSQCKFIRAIWSLTDFSEVEAFLVEFELTLKKVVLTKTLDEVLRYRNVNWN